MDDVQKNLLEQFVQTGDAEVFNEIVRYYAGLVYSASVRILGNRDQAADATQETFFQLLKNAGEVTGSLPSWLYRVATGKSVDLIRKDSRRRQKEAQYAEFKIRQVEKWEDLSPYVDEAVNELDEEDRQIIVQHFFENKPMATIAEEQGVSQPTISRRVEAAVSVLRDKLHAKGIIATASIINLFLLQNSSEAVPATVLNELGKMAIVGSITSTASAGTAASGGTAAAAGGAAALSFNAKIIIATAVAAVGLGGIATYKYVHKPVSEPVTAEQPSSIRNVPILVRPVQQAEPVPSRPVQQVRSGGGVADMNVIYGGGVGAMGYGGTGTVVATGQQTAVVDLNSPESTMSSFTKILASGDFSRLSECFVSGSENLTNLRQILDSDAPENAEMKQIFLSIGEPIEVANVSGTNEEGYDVTWSLTVTKPFTAGGVEYRQGDKFVMDTSIVDDNGRWLMK